MRTLILLLAALTLSALSACGFQLRGAYPLPFDSIHIGLPETGEMHAQLKRSIMAGSPAQVMSDVAQAQVQLQITEDHQAKNILSLSAAGRVREYQLVRTLGFRLVDGSGREWLAPARITVRRDISFNDDQVLSKESEESLLWRDIQNDLVQQLLRRLSAARLPVTTKPD
jgi:LPS-assembly lipoprotein